MSWPLPLLRVFAHVLLSPGMFFTRMVLVVLQSVSFHGALVAAHGSEAR